MSWDEKIACLVNVAFGAALGLPVFMFGLGGYRFLFLGKSTHWWNGWPGLLLCVGIGALGGWFSYRNRLKNLDIPVAGIYAESGGAELLWRRLVVIGSAIIAIYFIWQLAKGI
jgi:hypothetical protein